MPNIGEIKNGQHIGKKSSSRFIYIDCFDCGRPRWVSYYHYLRKKHQRCRECSQLYIKQYLKFGKGKKHIRWMGGKYISKGKHKGYVMVYVHNDHSFISMANPKRPYVPEHRLIMAEHLGRCLNSSEHVHHKNGIKTDNRIENLEITTNSQHHKDHHRGYIDGYQKGFIDGQTKQIKDLKNYIIKLEAELEGRKNVRLSKVI